MKSLKLIILTAVICMVFSLLSAQAQSNDDFNQPYQSQTFEFDQKQLPNSKNYQKKWNRMTGFEYSGLHWQQFIVVYTNIGERVYKHNFLQYSAWFDDPEDEDNEPQYQSYPSGTSFIKENYKMINGKPDKIESLTVMLKRDPGFNSDGGDWEYLQFNKDGVKMISGSGKDKQVNNTCASCHESVAERDYIFSNFYSGTSH